MQLQERTRLNQLESLRQMKSEQLKEARQQKAETAEERWEREF